MKISKIVFRHECWFLAQILITILHIACSTAQYFDRPGSNFIALRSSVAGQNLFSLSIGENEIFSEYVENQYFDVRSNGYVLASADLSNLDLGLQVLMVNITNTADFQSLVYTANIYVIDQDPVEANLFVTNTADTPPYPVRLLLTEWNRPNTHLITLQSLYEVQYDARVIFKIESGADGRFELTPNGELYTTGREPLVVDKEYRLAISTEVYGNIKDIQNAHTPTQTVTIFIVHSAPQFYNVNEYGVIEVDVYEDLTTQGRQSVFSLRAKSYFGGPFEVSYAWRHISPPEKDFFALPDSSRGNVYPTRPLSPATDPRAYVYELQATDNSQLISITRVLINLLPVNRHPPMFPVEVYVTDSIQETENPNTRVMEVSVWDMDLDAFGEIEFATSSADFSIVKTGRQTADIVVAQSLDYDRGLFPDRGLYEFTITATDNYNNDNADPSAPISVTRRYTATATVQVWVQDVPDEPPVFEPRTQTIRVKERLQLEPGQGRRLVGAIQAYDLDSDSITFSLQGGSWQSFELDENTGFVYLIRNLDDLTSDERSITVRAVGNNDLSGVYADGTLQIDTIGVNRPPVFTECRAYNFEIYEGEPNGTEIGIPIRATDEDSGSNGELQYRLREQDKVNFRIENRNGGVQLLSNKVFDREAQVDRPVYVDGDLAYLLTIYVEDNADLPAWTSCVLSVRILDVNDNPPRFFIVGNSNRYNQIISSSATQSDHIVQVHADDDDSGDNGRVTYSISSQGNCGRSNCFRINAVSGWITLASNVASQPWSSGSGGSDTITLTVEAIDNGDSPRSSTVEVLLERRSENLPPVWNNVVVDGLPEDIFTYTLRVSENSVGPIPALFHATPRVADFSINFYNTEPEHIDGWFISVSGPDDDVYQLEATNFVDYETTTRVTIALVASYVEDQNLRSVLYLTVEITDTNDFAPQFEGTITNVYNSAASTEFDPGDVIASVFAIDQDRSAPFSAITYSFKDRCDLCRDFSIDETTGVITLANELEAEPTSRVLRVEARNTDNEKVQGVNVLVTVIGPVTGRLEFESSNIDLTYTEGEDIPDHFQVVTATGPENVASNAQYAIISGNEDRKFTVETRSGVIDLWGSIRYTEERRVMTYRVFDGHQSDEVTLTVEILESNMFRPQFINSNGEFVSEYQAPVVREDEENVDLVRAQVAGTGLTNYELTGPLYEANRDKFSISRDGAIRLESPLDADPPNGSPEWVVNVKATHPDTPANRAGYALLNVDVRGVDDNPPVFDSCCYIGSVPENVGQGDEVMRVTATDVDGSPITYTIVPPDGDGEGGAPADDQPFAIDNNGVITTTGPLNREDVDQYHLTVVASSTANGARASATATATVQVEDVNDNFPRFINTPYDFTVAEQQPVGTSVAEVQAEDVDSDAELTFTILTPSDYYVDSIYATQTGAIKVAEESDYELLRDVPTTLTIEVSDGVNRATTTLTITLSDVNEPPVVRFDGVQDVIPENEAVGQVIAQAQATTNEDGPNGLLRGFYLDHAASDPDRNFKIGYEDGEISINKPLDSEKTDHYDLVVLAVDNGSPPQTGSATLSINITNVNDNAPQLSGDHSPWVARDSEPGQPIHDGIIPVTDADEGPNDGDGGGAGGRPWSVVPDCQAAQPANACDLLEFDFNPDTRELEVIASQREYKREDIGDEIEVPIVLSDGEQSRTTPLIITVESSNENRHTNGRKTVTVYNYQGKLGNNVLLGNVFVNDQDDWDRHEKQYRIIGDSTWFRLGEGADVGLLYMEQGAPPGLHELQVEVSDPGGSALSDIAVTVVYVYDDVIDSSASIRLAGYTAKQFIREQKLTTLRQSLAEQFGTRDQYVDVFTLRDAGTQDNGVPLMDVYYAAHGSPYYRPARLNGLVLENRQRLKDLVGADVVMAPISLCASEPCYEEGCYNELVLDHQPLLVNTNETSLVGINATIVASCVCPSRVYDDRRCRPGICKNNGTCIDSYQTYQCVCPEGFDGPNCEQSKHSFGPDYDHWAWYAPLQQCAHFSLSVELMTTSPSGLILYNGPMHEPAGNEARDFLSISLEDTVLVVRADLGGGELPAIRINTGSYTLNNGLWHTVQVFIDQQILRVVVDYCQNLGYRSDSVDGNGDAIDRSSCEMSRVITNSYTMLGVTAPLQLGGRADTNTNYPPALITDGINGCIKNLYNNDQLWDLYVGSVGESSSRRLDDESVGDGCPLERGCGDEACPMNSTCIGDMISDGTACMCLPGYRGEQCDIDTTTRDFHTEDSFMQWDMDFADSERDTFSYQFVSHLQVMFITNRQDAWLWSAYNYNKMELLRIQLSDSHPQFVYDLGSGEHTVSLLHVNASDGEWHSLDVYRYGNQLTLQMDRRDGAYRVSVPPDNSQHTLIILTGDEVIAAANVDYKYSEYLDNRPYSITEDLESGCMTDIRYRNEFFPMDTEENYISSAVELVREQDVRDGCQHNECVPGFCAAPAFCYVLFRETVCMCPGWVLAEPSGSCPIIVDCTVSPCVNGVCATLADGRHTCHCFEGWSGALCDERAPGPGELAAADTGVAIAIWIIILICALLVLIILLLVCFVMRRKNRQDQLLKVSEPEDYVGENIVFYDEEGAGEEDQTAYDISRLQKPVDPGDPDNGTMVKPPVGPITPVDDMRRVDAPPPLTRGISNPDVRSPDKYPNIGDFIGDRMTDADEDPNAPPYDSVREYHYEGEGSVASSLSSLASSSSSGDQDYDYLNNYGPKFNKLADLYNRNDDEDDQYDNQSEV